MVDKNASGKMGRGGGVSTGDTGGVSVRWEETQECGV